MHVRIDMQTGLKEAKLLEEENDETTANTSSALISTGAVEDGEEVEAELNHSEIKEALKKIKNDAKDTSEEKTGGSFRTYDQIKEEMKQVEQSIKTEYEIVKELVAKYKSLEDDSERQYILNDLEFYVHQYDNAQDFVKMGGFKDVVLPALNSTSKDLRSSAAFLLGKNNAIKSEYTFMPKEKPLLTLILFSQVLLAKAIQKHKLLQSKLVRCLI